jgi:hypothetical protein
LFFDEILASGNRILYSAFSSATDSLVETTGKDGVFAALLFFDLSTAVGGFFAAAAAMADGENPGSGCGVLSFNVGGFFAVFALDEHCGSGFGFALGLALEIASRESSATGSLVETTGKDGVFAAPVFFDLSTAAGGFFFFDAAAAMADDEHPGSGCGVLFFNVGGFFAVFALEDGSGFGFALGLALEIASRESSATGSLVETTGKDGVFAAPLFFDLSTAAGGFFFFDAAAAMTDEEHPGSGCGVLFFNVGGFFAVFALEDGSGFGFALGSAFKISSAEREGHLATFGFFAIGDPTCCDASFFFLVPFKDVSLSALLVDAVIQMDPRPKWFRNQSFFLDDKAVKDGFRSSAS